MTKPKISIIILNYNGLQDTIECIDSIFSSHKSWKKYIEIVIIDNGSILNEADYIRSRYNSKVKCIRVESNLGFTGGNNMAVSWTSSDQILLLNNDTTVTKNSIKILSEALDRSPKIGIVQPKIKYFYDREYFDYAGAAGGFIDKFGYPFTRGRIFNTLEKDNGQYDSNIQIFWASGAALAFKKKVLDKTGELFDRDLFNYMEEIDFCWRAMNSGFKVMAIPSSVVYHKVATTSKKYPIKKRYWEHRNNLLLLLKNLSKNDLAKIVFSRIMLEFISYIYYLFTLNINNAISLLLAHIDLITKIPTFIKKRKNDLSSFKYLPVYGESICFKHFIKGIRHYSQLNTKY